MRAIEVYKGSDGDVTRAYYASLCSKGRIGEIAMNLFRAQKCSSRAKVYRGGIRGQGSFRSMAYDRKSWSLEQLAKGLTEGAESGVRFGWKIDPDTMLHGQPAWVLYVDLPTGQVSFHSPVRYAGPDYSGDWDGLRLSDYRILAFCDAVMDDTMPETNLKETTGHGVQKAVSEDGMQEPYRSETQASEVLFGCMPAEGRPGDAQASRTGAL